MELWTYFSVEPSQKLEWLESKYNWRKVLLSLWCIQVDQANGAWRLNSFLCSNGALSVPKATCHIRRWLYMYSYGNNPGSVYNQAFQRQQAWTATNEPLTITYLPHLKKEKTGLVLQTLLPSPFPPSSFSQYRFGQDLVTMVKVQRSVGKPG